MAFTVANPRESVAPALDPPATSQASTPGVTAGNGVGRRRFLEMGAMAGAAFGFLAHSSNADIVDVLQHLINLNPVVTNFAFELEELEADFFEKATLSRGYNQLSSREQSVFNLIAQQDRAHFEVLDRVRDRQGERPRTHFETPEASGSREPSFYTFPNLAFENRYDLLAEAVRIKENAVAGYHGAVPFIDPAHLKPAVAIAGVEGRHLVVLREIAGMDPIPASFETASSPQVVGNHLARYGFHGGALRNE